MAALLPALLLALAVARCGGAVAPPARDVGVVVLPAEGHQRGGLDATRMVLLHDTIARDVARGGHAAPPLTTETPLTDFCREVLRTPHPVVMVEAAPPAEPLRCDTGGGWLRALGWSCALGAAFASAALNYLAARLWLRVLAPAACAAARGTAAVTAAALSPATGAARVATSMARAAGGAAMLGLEAASCGAQLARESLSFLTGGAQRELPPTLRGALRNATAALDDADGAALTAAVARRLQPLAPLRPAAQAAWRVAFAPARIALRVLHRPAADAAKSQQEESAQAPQFVPAGSRRDDGYQSHDDASPSTTPRAADTRGPLHATMCRLQRRHNAAA